MMGEPNPNEDLGWEVIILDRADADTKVAYEFLRPHVGEENAEEWARGFFVTAFGLADFPGPFAHAIDEEASQLFNRPTRKMLYRGGTRKRPIGAAYKVYFYTVEPSDVSERGGIFILRVLHGAAEPLPAPE